MFGIFNASILQFEALRNVVNKCFNVFIYIFQGLSMSETEKQDMEHTKILEGNGFCKEQLFQTNGRTGSGQRFLHFAKI